jgi:pimeloyl-ACP methyl ester carboxylesterase
MTDTRQNLPSRFVFSLLICIVVGSLTAQSQQSAPAQPPSQNPSKQVAPFPEVTRVPAKPEKGFLSPYYIFMPTPLLNSRGRNNVSLLVVPNNTGKGSDDPAVHEKAALREANDWRRLATKLNVGLLVPAFPRPAAHGLIAKDSDNIYTHALSRAALLTSIPEIQRVDLQLIHMIDDARSEQRHRGLRVNKRVLMFGFSASGMFTNRFVFLHPDRVLAAAFGSPGGWALAPVSSWNDSMLPYPVGVSDFKAVSGKNFHLRAVAKVPQFLFMGTADENDAVVYTDSYDKQSKKLIFDLFGGTLMARWPFTVRIYAQYLPNVQMKLYPEAKHEITKAMIRDCETFFAQRIPPAPVQ